MSNIFAVRGIVPAGNRDLGKRVRALMLAIDRVRRHVESNPKLAMSLCFIAPTYTTSGPSARRPARTLQALLCWLKQRVLLR